MQFKSEYGWPRVWKELLANGVRVGKERVKQLMAQHGIKAYTKRKFKAATNSAHALPVAPNLIERDFSPPCLIGFGQPILRTWTQVKAGYI